MYNALAPRSAKYQNSRNIPNFIFSYKMPKQMVPGKSTAEEVSFEWSHHRISSTDSKVRTTLHVSIIDLGSDRLIYGMKLFSASYTFSSDRMKNSDFSGYLRSYFIIRRKILVLFSPGESANNSPTLTVFCILTLSTWPKVCIAFRHGIVTYI